MNPQTENQWLLPQINVAEALLSQLNPFIITEPHFDPYQKATIPTDNVIAFAEVLSNVQLSVNVPFAIVSHYLDYPSNWHSHDYLELIYLPQGQILNVIDHTPYLMEAGSLCLIDQQVTHLISKLPQAEQSPLIINLLIKPQLFIQIAQLLDQPQIMTETLFDKENFLLFDKEALTNLQPLLSRLILEYYQNAFAFNGSILGWLLLFTEKLLALHQQNTVIYDELTEKCLILIKNDPVASSLTTIAATLNYSKGYLSRHIRQQTKKTISQLLMEAKLALAESYLAESDLTVATIAELSGYQSESHFYRLFKAQFHVTPKQYRQLVQLD